MRSNKVNIQVVHVSRLVAQSGDWHVLISFKIFISLQDLFEYVLWQSVGLSVPGLHLLRHVHTSIDTVLDTDTELEMLLVWKLQISWAAGHRGHMNRYWKCLKNMASEDYPPQSVLSVLLRFDTFVFSPLL